MPGGLGQVNVAVSMLFAGISGSSTADAAGCGKILIPAMIKKGYSPRFAVAITACSSVMGVIIPPSILMVVWGGVMSISVGALFLAGAIPGLLIAIALMGTVYGYANRSFLAFLCIELSKLEILSAFSTKRGVSRPSRCSP